jgi:putative flippase GtrA
MNSTPLTSFLHNTFACSSYNSLCRQLPCARTLGVKMPESADLKIGTSKPNLIERLRVLGRSAAVGLVATISDLATLTLLVHVAGLSKRVGNKYFAFEDSSKKIVKQGSLFLLIEAVAFGLNVLLFDLLVTLTPIHEILARLLGTNITYLGFSFPLWSFFVFRMRTRTEPPHERLP